MNEALFKSLKVHISIPAHFSIGHAGGEVRILVAGALAAPAFQEELVSAWKDEGKHLARRFKEFPIKQDDLIGAQLAERPILEETAFVSYWEENGLQAALSEAKLNPMFQHIHLFLSAQVAFCNFHRINTHRRAHPRYFEHLRMLRYLLHATT